MKYNRVNNLVGLGVFLITFITYALSVAPTASFWDCGEFIATSNELEVPHPPGAPLFLIIGRLFAMLAPNVASVAHFINFVSVFAGAGTTLFICWTTTMLARKILVPNGEAPNATQTATIMFAGAVAGLTTAFLDSMWFNSAEAEVYASSSLFTTAVFWLMLKWEARADEPFNLKWIVLIAYLTGLAVGVHLLGLLTIPAMGLLYYFRKYTYSNGGFAIALLVLLGILAVVLFGIIPKTWDIAWKFEEIFTGTINLETGKTTGWGLPFGTGTIVFLLLLVAALVFGIYYTHIHKYAVANTALICVAVFYLGFSSYSQLLIRSAKNPPIDQNHPADMRRFIDYLSRKQYGAPPLLHGQMYNSTIIDQKNTTENFYVLQGQSRYIEGGYDQEYVYEPRTLRYFPRMYDPAHYDSGPYGYKNYVTDKGANPNDPSDDKPSGGDNFHFFVDYQVNHMYLRYFMWNFVGRESDVQHADWESGWNFKKLKAMPKDMREDRTRNHYYALPLLLGLIGLFFHFYADWRRATVLTVLFLFTGLAIVVMLNQVAQEPRERDYAFVGSYHTFAIWVGLSVLMLVDLTRRTLKGSAPYIMGTICLIAGPGIMLSQNWDDHTRAGDFVPPDSAYNLLNSCAKNAIMFTNGDNDTFPLWYLQEVEGIRTDVRVVNLSLLNTDWYIHQLKTVKWNNSDSLPISLKPDWYMGEQNSARPFRTQTFAIPLNKAQLVADGVVAAADTANMANPMLWKVPARGKGENSYLMKQDALILDMVVTNASQGWKRPIYFANTVGPSNFIGLGEYFELQGMAYRVIPYKDPRNSSGGFGRVNLPVMYTNVMDKYRYRGLNDPKVFFGENTERMIGNFRNTFFRLSTGYLEAADELQARLPKADPNKPEQKHDPEIEAQIATYRRKAKEAVDYGLKTITPEAVPMQDFASLQYAYVYDQLGDTAASDKLLAATRKTAVEHLAFTKAYGRSLIEDSDTYVQQLRRILQIYMERKDPKSATGIANDLYEATGDQQYKDLVPQLMNQPPVQQPLPIQNLQPQPNAKPALKGGKGK